MTTPMSVFKTTADTTTTDGMTHTAEATAAPSIYEIDKFMDIVRLVKQWSEAEMRDKLQ